MTRGDPHVILQILSLKVELISLLFEVSKQSSKALKLAQFVVIVVEGTR